jgi:hypothetical protein
MKGKKVSTVVVALVLVAFAASMSSCNRGYGCPTNFSIGKILSAVTR